MWKAHLQRAAIDVAVLLAVVVVVLTVLWAYQGHQAFAVIQATIQQQQAAQRPTPPQP